MKTPRAGRGQPASKAILPPPLPPFDDLEALAAADTPSLASAWWITHQVSEHVSSAIAQGDPRTGAPLPRPLTEILRDIRAVTAAGSRPFPHDRLLYAAEFAADSLGHLLDRHSHRIVRSHEQLPFHQLREVDIRSMAWLARQPGRNIREKLSGRTHALGVKRDVSADTTENQLLRSFAKLFTQRARSRMAYAGAYDGAPADLERIHRIEECVRLCDERMRRSGLADVPRLTRIQPNNVLLSDPHYSRIFRAWKWLRDDEEALRESWGAALHRVRILLCWMVASQLAIRERVVIVETLGRVLSGRGDDQRFGVELLDSSGNEPSWLLNPPLEFLTLPSGNNDAPFRIRMSLEGEFIIVHIATLSGEGQLKESSVSALTFEVRASADYLQPQRGIGIVIDGGDVSLRDVDRVHADIAGLAPLSIAIAQQILQRCRVDPRIEKSPRVPPGITDGARLGIELGNTSLHASNENPIPLAAAPWALALNLPKDTGDFEWLDGRGDQEFVVGTSGQSWWATGDILDVDEQADTGMVALAADRVLNNLASELDVPGDVRIAYAVPDAVDEFSQRSLRSAFATSFHRPVPVWRSIAAAMAWVSAAGERGPHRNESIVVVDTEFASVSLTVLTARYDEKLARRQPASHGIYWERKPPLPPDEQLEMLGWPHVLRGYARMLVARTLGSHTPDQQERIVNDLLRTGQISTLVEQGGSIFAQVVSGTERPPKVINIFDDPEWLDDAVARWSERIDKHVRSAHSIVRKARVVLIGGPCAFSRFSTFEPILGRIKVFNETKGAGIIVPEGSADKVYFQVDSWASGRSPRLNDLVAFEIQKGKKGPEAKRVRLAPRPNPWLQGQTRVTPQQLAGGARECLLRFDCGTPAWREWLPELSLEVVRSGHFGELPLLEQGTFVDPFLGESVQFTVPETLTLGRGHRWFLFPLLIGQQDRRPMAWEARLDSPSFPLDHDVRVRLKLAYRYGLENSYELVVEPESLEVAPFTRIEAKWVKGGDAVSTGSNQEAPIFCTAPWTAEDAKTFVSAASNLARLSDEKFGRFLFAVCRGIWSQGRSIATAPLEVQQAFPGFRSFLLLTLGQARTLNIHQLPRVLEILALLHEDAPESIVSQLLSLDDEAADNRDLYKKTAAMMAMLVGDGTGDRVFLLERLLARLRRYTDVDTFDGALTGVTMRAIGNAAWRHPDLVTTLAAHPGAVGQILGQCRRSLQNLMMRVPLNVASEEERKQVAGRLGTPFRDSCELLLALLRIESSNPAVASLRSGSPSADSFAKTVRQIDARFAALGVEVHWRVQLNVELPSELHRMSRVAFALNSYLSKGAGTNLVRVTGVEAD
jgi:cold shock CspA family protein